MHTTVSIGPGWIFNIQAYIFSADDIKEVSEEEDNESEDEYKPSTKKKSKTPAKKSKPSPKIKRKSPATRKSAEKKV